MTKLWQKENIINKSNLQGKVEAFTIGTDKIWDLYIAEYDVIGSLAHVKMLESIGLISSIELYELEQGLSDILNSIKQGKFIIEDGVEDVHSQVEILLTRAKGDIGKKIHSGRSRNDQALLDIKLLIKNEIITLALKTEDLFNIFISLSNKYKNNLMPGYTHMQIAMPSSFGLWFGAYAESLCDDLELLISAYNIANRNPLGSGAGYGSSFPLDRKKTTELLGFENMNFNVVYAQMTRGKTEKVAAIALSAIAATLSKFAMDVCLYMNQNFGFISFPNELTTGSSIMPHKKNPDVFELVRAKSNIIQALPNQITLLVNNLPSGYHRDMQLTKESLFPAFNELKNCLEMVILMLENIIIKKDILSDKKYNHIFSVELVNSLVLEGVPFRDAYLKVASLIENNEFESLPELNHTHDGSIGNLRNDKIEEIFKSKLAKIVN
jgi:argininosuccinate lyase